jgi:hypothetical protein
MKTEKGQEIAVKLLVFLFHVLKTPGSDLVQNAGYPQ